MSSKSKSSSSANFLWKSFISLVISSSVIFCIYLIKNRHMMSVTTLQSTIAISANTLPVMPAADFAITSSAQSLLKIMLVTN